jgi:hypothetical protein
VLAGVRVLVKDVGRPCVLFAISAHYVGVSLWAQIAVVGVRAYLLTIHLPAETGSKGVRLAVVRWCQHPNDTTGPVRCAYRLPVDATVGRLGLPVIR